MPDSPLNFHRAEYGGDAIPLDRCAWCGRGLEKQFYRANEAIICVICAIRAMGVTPADTNRTFWRSVAWGAVAAIGLSLATFLLNSLLMSKVGGWGAGITMAGEALGAGYLIGKTMRFASKGAGGTRYQIAAAILTYCCVTIATAGSFLGVQNVPVWALPLLTLSPIAWLFTGRTEEAGFVLTLAFIGIRWAWMWLKPWPLKVTGPEMLQSVPEDCET